LKKKIFYVVDKDISRSKEKLGGNWGIMFGDREEIVEQLNNFWIWGWELGVGNFG
jgi:hypothetical protein